MFGYVRVRPDTLPEENTRQYESVYCGLCRVLGQEYGFFSRLLLNYDFVFLAMLLAPRGESFSVSCEKCPLHPIKGKPSCECASWMETAAGEGVILGYWKLRDTIADSSLLKGLPARFMRLCLGRAYRKAKSRYPDYDLRVEQCMTELWQLEREKSSSLDRTADCFARLLSGAAPLTGDASRDRPREQLLYHLGRWIYLIDAVDDLSKDRRRGSYNPLLARFPMWEEEDKTYLRQMLDHSLNLMGAAYQLLESNAWSPVMENVIYSGLPNVEALVFSGQWQEAQKRHRRSDL